MGRKPATRIVSPDSEEGVSSETGDGGVGSNFYAPTVSVSVTYFFHMNNLIPELAAVAPSFAVSETTA
jgi:hypothetical protein